MWQLTPWWSIFVNLGKVCHSTFPRPKHFCVSSRCKPVVDASNLGLSIVYHKLTDVHWPEIPTRYPRWARAIASCGIESPVLSPVTWHDRNELPQNLDARSLKYCDHVIWKRLKEYIKKHTGIIKPRKPSAIWGFRHPPFGLDAIMHGNWTYS